MATLVTVPSQAPGKSDESGKSRLLVSEKMATRLSSGEVDVRRLQRTVIPVPYQALAGVDEDGNPAAMDMDLVEQNLELYSLLIEYSQTPIYSPEGVYCMPAWDNLRVWDGVILLRHGLYHGGVFKFKININTGYPVTPPSITFLSRVYHPLIDPKTGELSIKPQFHSWNGEKDYLPMLLMYLKSIFYKKEFLHGTDMEDMWLNVEAAAAFRGEKKPVLESIRECVKESQSDVYKKIDDFVFNFTEFHREKKPVLQALNVLAHDVTCVDPKEAFVDWFLDDWCRKEFGGEEQKDTASPKSHEV